MVSQTAKVKNGTITLPQELRKSWKGAEVFIRTYKDKIIIERPKTKNRIFSKDTERKLQALGKEITQKDIERAIQWARKESE